MLANALRSILSSVFAPATKSVNTSAPPSEDETVVAGTAGEDVVARAAVQRVCGCAAEDRVVERGADDVGDIAQGAAGYRVREVHARRADQHELSAGGEILAGDRAVDD